MNASRLPDNDTVERTVLAPLVALVAAVALGFGVARACCGIKWSRIDSTGMLPVLLAAFTSGVALFTYLNPRPSHLGEKGKSLRKTGRRKIGL